ncbi:MAG: response regulator [Desulfocapsaceae bacterium]|nr:response regulator [Desulfocapsaceae bacterium]
MSEITNLKQMVHTLEQELELQKKITESLQKLTPGSCPSQNQADCDLRIEQEVERRTRELRSALEQARNDKRKESEFLANISHEILTPMDGILGMTGLVLETELTQDQRRYLEMVSASADRLLSVVNDILDYSQIMAGRLQLLHSDFDLSDLLECDLYILKLAAEHKKIDLLHYIDPDIPQYVSSDPDRLRQVLVNLVNNAIKFTEKGLVTVDVTIAEYAAGKLTLKFSITDTGIGVPLEKQKGLFDLMGAARDDHSGTGLGLAVSAKLVELAGGEIGLESASGEGATFWFTWPLVESSQQDKIPARMVDDETGLNSFILKGAKVLLAEDEPISGALTETLLQQAGIAVTMVENGIKAVEEIEKGDYGVVLMDVQMPVMDGLTATQQVRDRERRAGGHQSIIALTAYALQGDRERCLQAGMDDYLTKPVNKDQLLDMLTRYLTKTALVVGGDPLSQPAAVKALVELGWRVSIVETGRSAVYEASLTNFDLIMIETGPAQSDGIETARAIRRLEEYSGRRAAIIGIGMASGDDLEECTNGGIDDFIDLPVSKDQLQGKLRQLQELQMSY